MIDYRYALAAAIRVSPRGLICGCMAEDQFVCCSFSDMSPKRAHTQGKGARVRHLCGQTRKRARL